jgi:predicted nucleotidyltransferase
LTSTPIDFGGVWLRVAEVADLLVYKAIAWRDRDRLDVENLIAKHWARLDLDRVRALVAQFADALEVPERVGEFEAVVRRAVGPHRE